jgi:ribosomal protein S18 acetylase RimI-like enzyme
VLPCCQNKGIGKQLMQSIEREYSGKRFELFTGAKSMKNIKLYEKCGYSIYKKEESTSGLTFVYMEKRAAHDSGAGAGHKPAFPNPEI